MGFVSYGGSAGGLRAVEQLRLVFAELHAVTIKESVSFHGIWSAFDSNGEPVDAQSGGRAMSMFDRLHWWGAALRDARAEKPYHA